MTPSGRGLLQRREVVILHEVDQNQDDLSAKIEIAKQLRLIVRDHGRAAAIRMCMRMGVYDRFPTIMEGL